MVSILVMWCILLTTLDMFWWMYEWLMNAWTNKCYCNYYERTLDLLGDSQINFRLIWSYMHSWHVAYMFTICLMKWLSWLGLVRSISWSSFVWMDFSWSVRFHRVMEIGLEASLNGGLESRTAPSKLETLGYNCTLIGICMWLEAYNHMEVFWCM